MPGPPVNCWTAKAMSFGGSKDRRWNRWGTIPSCLARWKRAPRSMCNGSCFADPGPQANRSDLSPRVILTTMLSVLQDYGSAAGEKNGTSE